MNADPAVMEFYPSILSDRESLALIEKFEASFASEGFGIWALELKGANSFIGYVGLSRPSFEAHFTPCVEIGWRVAREFWGSGLAVEGAKEAMRDGFQRLQLEEIVSFTAAINDRSIRVMEKIGMARNPKDDFLHPLLEDGDRLKPHVLFRLARSNWYGKGPASVV